MVTTKFYIQGTEVLPPKNWMELGIELNYGKDEFPQGNTVTITDFEWVRENYDWFSEYIDKGLTGDVGIFEAPEFRIDITNGTTTNTVFDGYIDLTQVLVKHEIKIIGKAVSQNTVDWINEVANGFTFEYLASLPAGAKGRISSDDYVFVPYVNNSVPNYLQSAITTLMVYTVSSAITKELSDIADIVADVSGVMNSIGGAIKLVIKIAYLVVLIVTLIKLIEDMVKFIISPVKYHAGMRTRDLLTKGCEYLGKTFKSDIFAPNSPFYNEVIIPEKFYNAPSKLDSSLIGFLVPDKNEQIGYYKGTFGQFLEAMKTKYNAKIVVDDTSIYLLRRDKNAKPPKYQLPDIYQPEYTYNSNELISNYLIEFRTDGQDTNTYQNYQGTIYQVITQPIKVNYRPYVMMKNLNMVSIPFARATRKTELTAPEKILDVFMNVFGTIINALISAANLVIKVINAVTETIRKILKFFKIKVNIPAIPYLKKTTIKNMISNRIGMMCLSNDHFTTPKCLILKEGSEAKYNKIDSTNATIEDAKYHWDNFHYVNSFIPKQLNSTYSDRPYGNQYKIKNYDSVPFTWDNFIDVFTNNRIYDSEGNPAILESLKFLPYKQKASLKIRTSHIYSLNLQETFLYPNGS